MEKLEVPTNDGITLEELGIAMEGRRPLTHDEEARAHAIRILAQEIQRNLKNALMDGAEDRYISEAQMRLEESVMWAVRAIGV
ncbi:MAG: hypothetical protein SVU69_07300 [Pseudomonadota bacterium]|nr:hypothetical protein [Pseudomonadota bacterium]